MKTIAFVLSLVLLSNLSLSAQTDGKTHPITKESFKVKIKVQKKQSFDIISFVSSKGEKRSAKIIDPGELTELKLTPGTVIEGIFRFDTFASDGGLGTTRVAKGRGKGDLRVSNIIVTEVNPMVSKLAGVGDMAIRLN